MCPLGCFNVAEQVRTLVRVQHMSDGEDDGDLRCKSSEWPVLWCVSICAFHTKLDVWCKHRRLSLTPSFDSTACSSTPNLIARSDNPAHQDTYPASSTARWRRHTAGVHLVSPASIPREQPSSELPSTLLHLPEVPTNDLSLMSARHHGSKRDEGRYLVEERSAWDDMDEATSPITFKMVTGAAAGYEQAKRQHAIPTRYPD